MKKVLRTIKGAAMVATILALGAGSVLAQERARLGVYPDMEQGREMDQQGARIQGVVEGSPADEAGLQEGDILVSLNGRSLLEPLPDPEDEDDLDMDNSLPVQRLYAAARKLDPGDEVEIVYLRDGQRRTTTLTAEAVGMGRVRVGEVPREMDRRLRELRERERDLRGFMRDNDEGHRAFFRRHEGERPGVYRFFGGEGEPGTFRFRTGPLGRCPGEHGGWAVLTDGCVAGVRLVPLNPRLGRYFEAEEGVLVADVVEDSELGLEPGDVILSIDGREVDEPSDVTRILRSYREGESVTFRVVRQGDRRTVNGTVE